MEDLILSLIRKHRVQVLVMRMAVLQHLAVAAQQNDVGRRRHFIATSAVQKTLAILGRLDIIPVRTPAVT